MGYLYLNFLENMNQGSKSWDDFYTSSLKEQYEVIKRKVGLNINLQEFLSYAFPTQTSKTITFQCLALIEELNLTEEAKM